MFSLSIYIVVSNNKYNIIFEWLQKEIMLSKKLCEVYKKILCIPN